MKINNNPNVQKVIGAYKSKINKIEKTNKTMEFKDKVEISDKAKDFQVAMQAIKKLPEVRQEKIDGIKNAIKAGTYNPSAEEVVDKMLERINFDKKI